MTLYKGGVRLSKEAVDAVLEAENKAKETKSRAAAKARAMISSATDDGKARLEAARVSCAADMNEKLELISKQAGALLEKSRADAEGEAAEMWRGSRKNLDDAVAVIIGEIRKNADN